MPSLADIRRALAGHEPTALDFEAAQRAAVAMVLREKAGNLDLLFIERASREGDPWSGHMALPGGRVAGTDRDPRAAAERETLEEVGLSLDGAENLGQLDDMRGSAGTAHALVVSAFVFHAVQPPPLVLNSEVQAAFWIPIASLLDSNLHVDHTAHRDERIYTPGVLVGSPGRQVVWGMTYRFLERFFEILHQPFPPHQQS